MMDELMASATTPMPLRLRQHQLVSMYQGLRALELDESPTVHNWRVVSDCVNLFETLVEMGVVEDSSNLLTDAVHALGAAGARHTKGGAIRLDGPGIKAVRATLEDYAGILEVVSHRTMVRCHRLTEKRIHEILLGKRRRHDVTICSI